MIVYRFITLLKFKLNQGLFVKLTILALLPIILSLGIISAIPFIGATEYIQICIDKVGLKNLKERLHV